MRIINQNIYRLLGIYANSTLKEAVAQMSKARAYVKVGEHLETPLQMNGWLPRVSMTEDVLKMVEDTLQSESEKHRHSLFWLERQDAADDEFIQLFNQNKTRLAIRQLDQRGDRIALKNAMVASFILEETSNAIGYAQRVYQDKDEIRCFVEEVARDKFISLVSLFENCQDETWRDVIREVFFNDCNRKIEDCYTQADLVSMDDSNGMERVLRLFLSTAKVLINWGKMVGEEDIYHQQTAEEFANKMLDAVKKYDNICHATKVRPNSKLVLDFYGSALCLAVLDSTQRRIYYWLYSEAHFKYDHVSLVKGEGASGCFDSEGCGIIFVVYVFLALMGAVAKQCGSNSNHHRYEYSPPSIPRYQRPYDNVTYPNFKLDTVKPHIDDYERIQELLRRKDSLTKITKPIKPVNLDSIKYVVPVPPVEKVKIAPVKVPDHQVDIDKLKKQTEDLQHELNSAAP